MPVVLMTYHSIIKPLLRSPGRRLFRLVSRPGETFSQFGPVAKRVHPNCGGRQLIYIQYDSTATSRPDRAVSSLLLVGPTACGCCIDQSRRHAETAPAQIAESRHFNVLSTRQGAYSLLDAMHHETKRALRALQCRSCISGVLLICS